MITEQVVRASLVQKREQRDATGWVCLGVVRMTAEHGALNWETKRQSRQPSPTTLLWPTQRTALLSETCSQRACFAGLFSPNKCVSASNTVVNMVIVILW